MKVGVFNYLSHKNLLYDWHTENVEAIIEIVSMDPSEIGFNCRLYKHGSSLSETFLGITVYNIVKISVSYLQASISHGNYKYLYDKFTLVPQVTFLTRIGNISANVMSIMSHESQEPGMHVTNRLWAHQSNFIEILLLWVLMIKSGHNFAHAMTAHDQWHFFFDKLFLTQCIYSTERSQHSYKL